MTVKTQDDVAALETRIQELETANRRLQIEVNRLTHNQQIRVAAADVARKHLKQMADALHLAATPEASPLAD